jgi:hypothetical protein
MAVIRHEARATPESLTAPRADTPQGGANLLNPVALFCRDRYIIATTVTGI